MKGLVYSQPDIDTDIAALDRMIQALMEKNEVSYVQLLKLLKEKRKESKPNTFPISILKNKQLGILEVIVKYLKEEQTMRYADIARLLNRDDRIIWVTYRNALRKFPKRLNVIRSEVEIPLDVLTDRRLGVLESISTYMHDVLKFSFRDIGLLIGRDNRTVWACYHKAQKKNG